MSDNQDNISNQESMEDAERILKEADIIPEELPSTQQAALLSMEQKKISNPTRINKLVMHGLKSFAKHTEILLTG